MVVRVVGEVDIVTAPSLEAALEVAQSATERVLVDRPETPDSVSFASPGFRGGPQRKRASRSRALPMPCRRRSGRTQMFMSPLRSKGGRAINLVCPCPCPCPVPDPTNEPSFG